MQCYAVNIAGWDPSPESFDRLLRLIRNDSIRDRIKRLRIRKDALRSLLGKVLPLWDLKSNYEIETINDFVEGKSSNGRPHMASVHSEHQLSGYDFNVSHDGDWVVLVSTKTTSMTSSVVGVDVMHLSLPPGLASLPELEETVSTLLCEAERRTIVQFSDEDRLQVLLRYWTCKEAVAKAFGQGLSFPFVTLDLSQDLQKEAATFTVQGRSCYLGTTELQRKQERYLVAIALLDSDTPPKAISVKQIRIDSILDAMRAV